MSVMGIAQTTSPSQLQAHGSSRNTSCQSKRIIFHVSQELPLLPRRITISLPIAKVIFWIKLYKQKYKYYQTTLNEKKSYEWIRPRAWIPSEVLMMWGCYKDKVAIGKLGPRDSMVGYPKNLRWITLIPYKYRLSVIPTILMGTRNL